jgi:DNA repair exonuclease SbcCD ATPase subunit
MALGQNINSLMTSKQHIEEQSCPTCKQTWIGDSAAGELTNLEAKIKNLIDQALALKTKIDQENVINATISVLQTELAALTTPDTSAFDLKIAEFEKSLLDEQTAKRNLEQTIENEYLKKYSEYKESYNKIATKNDLEIQQINQLITTIKCDPTVNKIATEIASLRNLRSTAIQSLNYYNNSLEDYNVRINFSKKLIMDKQKESELLLDSHKAKMKEVLIAQETKRLIKSYTLQIFQETLDTVGENAGQILSKASNTATCSIYFEGCKETKSGTIKDEVNAIVNMNGENDIPIKTLSGGQRTVIDLAVDLAVIDVIENKVGKGASFFIIDEPFDGCCSETKEQLLEMFQQLNTGKQLILVDHSPELKQMIRDVITIE